MLKRFGVPLGSGLPLPDALGAMRVAFALVAVARVRHGASGNSVLVSGGRSLVAAPGTLRVDEFFRQDTRQGNGPDPRQNWLSPLPPATGTRDGANGARGCSWAETHRGRRISGPSQPRF